MNSTDTRSGRDMPAPVSPPAKSNLPSLAEQPVQGIGQAAFWRPRHMIASPVLGQVPFLFWLAETAAPRVILQLGPGDGTAYLALCQAAERLNSGTVCLALDGGKALSPDLLARHDDLYADFSQIVADPDHLARSLPEGGEIDLLVLGAPLDPAALAVLRDDILPRLSGGAVILLVDPGAVLADPALRQILAEHDRPRVTLGPVAPGGAALELILHGAGQPERLRRLVVQRPGHPSWLTMRQAFNRLGQGLVALRQSRDLLADRDGLRARLEQAEAAARSLRTEVGQAQESEAVQIRRQAELAADLHDLRQAAARIEPLTAERDDLARQVDELTAARDAAAQRAEEQAARAAAAHRAEIEDLRRQLAAARAEHDTRIDDIAVLTEAYRDDLGKAGAKAAQDRKEAEKKAAKAARDMAEAKKNADKRIAVIRQKLSEVEAHRDELLSSTSWKITSPLRKATKAVRGY